MTKYYGNIGFSTTELTAPGVYSEVITERPYTGDITRDTRRMDKGVGLNDDLRINNLISIVADTFLNSNAPAIKYVTWLSVRWKVTNFEIRSPRLILTLGGIYNGPTS